MHCAYKEAMKTAGVVISKNLENPHKRVIDIMDIYACFPIAVEHGCDNLGLNAFEEDIERLTATGK